MAAELEDIRERGYLRVAVKENWRPLGFRDSSGDLVGLEIDIAQGLAAAILGDASALQLQPVDNQRRLEVLLADEVDLVIAGLGMTPARMRIVAFSLPYYLDGLGLITDEPAFQDADDLRWQTVAVLEGSDAIATLRNALPQVRLTGVDSYWAARDLLLADGAAAFAGDVSVLTGWVQEQPEFHLLPSLLSGEPLAVAMPKGVQYDELRWRVNEQLQTWHDSGWLEERATFWGLP